MIYLCLGGTWVPGIKVAGWFVEILVYSEQGDHSRCLPESRILVVCKFLEKLELLWSILWMFYERGDWIMDALRTKSV